MIRKILIALSAALVLSSCEKLSFLVGGDDDGETQETLSLTPRKTTLDAAAGSVFLAVSASGSWTLSAEYSSGASWGTLETTSGSGSKGDVRFRYNANSGSSRQVSFVLRSGKNSVSVAIRQLGAGEGTIAQYGYDVPPMDWLELPACSAGDGRELLVHNMDGGKYVSNKSGVRNWSCYWDYKEHMSLWVAYPLNKSLRGSGERSNTWGVYDPCIPSTMQPNMGVTYGGGWTRGHQIPSADRLNYNANVSTFYPTNMTPQDYDFNSYIWADLEGRVRSWSQSSDTLYVVTGCCYANSTRTSGQNSGFAVKIPTHYFKALLYKGSSTYATETGGYVAAGFYLPHDSSISGGNYMDYMITVDELEQLTGIDFFPNLSLKIGAQKADKVESQTTSLWTK